MPDLPDNRIRLSSGPIDFTNEVGVTGQDHDDYPGGGDQPRFDHMRMFLIGLLSMQSSYEAPTQYRQGTPWFDLNENALKMRVGSEWVPAADAILIADDFTLGDWYREFVAMGIAPEIRFNGTQAATSDEITIPAAARGAIEGKTDLEVDLFLNGVLQNPDEVVISSGVVRLTSGDIALGTEYVVVIKNVGGSVTSIINNSFTPSGTADDTGEEGDTAYDDDYLYVKTSAGWKRAALSSF